MCMSCVKCYGLKWWKTTHGTLLSHAQTDSIAIKQLHEHVIVLINKCLGADI